MKPQPSGLSRRAARSPHEKAAQDQYSAAGGSSEASAPRPRHRAARGPPVPERAPQRLHVRRHPALALSTAGLFAVHPVHTEAVDGIVGRAELISACFVFLTLLVAWRIVHQDDAERGRSLARARTLGPAMAGGLLLLALLSKETAI